MARKRIKARRSHKMMRNAGFSEPKSLPLEAFKGGCCKMFFPMDETSGTTITDVFGGVVFTPDELNFVSSDSIQIHLETAAPTVGAMPSVGEKDFALLGVYNGITNANGTFPPALTRAESTLRLKTATGGEVGYFDGDGFTFAREGAVYGVGTETLYGAFPADYDTYCKAAVGVVRNNDVAGIYLHNNDYWHGGQPHGTTGPYVQQGSIISRNIRNDIVGGSGSPCIGACGRSDYGVPTKYVDNYILYASTGAGSIDDPVFEANEYRSGLPGTWGKIGLNGTPQALEAFTTMSIGSQTTRLTDVNVEYFGIALFVFDTGLPADFLEAFRWMETQWRLGNKVIWPDWVSVV